jgi:hypothetical protein
MGRVALAEIPELLDLHCEISLRGERSPASTAA